MNTIEQDLALLGGSVPQIVESLTNLHIKGWRGNSYHCPIYCPIYNYLQRKEHHDLIAVSPSYVDTQDGAIATPTVVRDFITRFDAGAYPTLEAT